MKPLHVEVSTFACGNIGVIKMKFTRVSLRAISREGTPPRSLFWTCSKKEIFK